MDIDTRVDGQNWWLVAYPGGGEPFVVTEEAYWAIQDTPPPDRCEVEVAGSHRGQQCPNYCEPGEYTCRAHPLLSDDPW